MANKKYKLTDGNYWATDGIHDFGQNKTQREINAALVQADSDLSGAITTLLGKDFEYRGEVDTGTDIDTLYQNGWYELAYSGTYSNIPEVSGTVGQRHIYIYSEENPSLIKYKFMYYVNYKTGVVGFRIKSSMVWQPWRVIQGAINNTVNYTKTFSPTGITTAPSYNKGKRIKICQYNVANYNNDTSVYMPDNKVLNFRRFLAQEKFDFVCTQEDREYIDANDTKSSLQYLYYPMLNEHYCFAQFHQTIHCNQLRDSSFPAYKFKMPNSDSASRRIQVMLTNVAGKKVLLMSAHCSWRDFDADDPTSAANIAGRLAQYQAIYNWENGTSTLHRIDNDAEVSCPSHDIAIICMDANCVTNTDKNNLLNLFNANGWQAGNGGRFGWFNSDLWNGDTSGMVSLDFCAVKGDVIINDCRPMYEWLPLLYSDHVPVEFDITILNPEPDSYTPTYSEKVTANATYNSVYVKDGIAYVKLTMTVAQQMNGGAPELVSGLPHPKKQFQFVGFNYKGSDVYDNIKIKFNTDGTVQSWYSPVLDVGDIFSIDTTYAVE